MFSACKTQTTSRSITEKITEQMKTNPAECPEDGTCSVTIHKNKVMNIMPDKATGGVYPTLTDGDGTVVEYTFLREGPPGTVDGNYSETIHFEIPANTTNLKKVNTALTDVKLLYGKHCYCKGEAGYYPISEGTLILEKSETGIVFDLDFRVNKTSQVVSHITEMVKY